MQSLALTATKRAVRRYDASYHRLLDPALLPLASQPHSTARPSPKRYDNRFKGKILKNIDPHHRSRGNGGSGDMEGSTSHLTSFSNNGEYPSQTL
jgi:hypothetical protein